VCSHPSNRNVIVDAFPDGFGIAANYRLGERLSRDRKKSRAVIERGKTNPRGSGSLLKPLFTPASFACQMPRGSFQLSQNEPAHRHWVALAREKSVAAHFKIVRGSGKNIRTASVGTPVDES